MTDPTQQAPRPALSMPAVNQACLAGRLHMDPEYRITEAGGSRLSFRMCVTRVYQAERGADGLRKGTPVFVTGRLASHSWRDEDDHPHSIVEIEARAFQHLERDHPTG